jgi:hypothetical protein
LNIILFAIVAIAFVFAGWRQIFAPAAGQDSAMELLSKSIVDAAGGAVELAIGLVGVMTLFYRIRRHPMIHLQPTTEPKKRQKLILCGPVSRPWRS